MKNLIAKVIIFSNVSKSFPYFCINKLFKHHLAMNKDDIKSAVGLLFIMCLIFVILAVFNAFGEQVRAIMLGMMSVLSVIMIGYVCIKSLIDK